MKNSLQLTLAINPIPEIGPNIQRPEFTSTSGCFPYGIPENPAKRLKVYIALQQQILQYSIINYLHYFKNQTISEGLGDFSMPNPVRFRPLLDFIARCEGTANQPGGGYNTSLGYGAFLPGRREMNLTSMTLGQIDALQSQMLPNRLNSSALGRYQIVRRTLRGLRAIHGIPITRLFSPQLQDFLGAALIQGRGRNVNGLRLEWASLAQQSSAAILRAYDQVGPGAAPTSPMAAAQAFAAEEDAADAPPDLELPDGAEAFAPEEPFAPFAQEQEFGEPFSFQEPAPDMGEDADILHAYHVEQVEITDRSAIQDALDRLTGQGWHLAQAVPERRHLLLIMEKKTSGALEDETDDSPDAMLVAELAQALALPGTGVLSDFAARAPADGFDESAFAALFAPLNLKNFTYREFLVLGGQHFSGPCRGLNTLPPRNLWPNILPTARVLDRLRDVLGAPITTNSVYRSEAYNACLDGTASGSLHKQFKAVDFKCADGRGPVHWARALKTMRDRGEFKGGIGVYQTFVHVDTRGSNANFGPLRGQVF